MQALQIPDVRDFMTKLLTTAIFDTFLVTETTLTTFTTFHMDGSFHADYYGSMDTDEETKKPASSPSWKQVRPFFFYLVKGKYTPLNFKIVFRLADYNTEKLLAQSGVPLHIQDSAGLYLNILYDGKNISCTTGTSVRVFTLDRSLDHAWDDMVRKFLRQKEIPYITQ